MALYIAKKGKDDNVEGRTQIPVRFHRWVESYGLNGVESPHKWLSRALYLSAPFTHPEGNRRFEDVIMDVQDNRLMHLTFFDPDCDSCHDTGVFVAIDEDGTRNEWPCPDCQIDKRASARENVSSRQGGKYRDKNKRRKRPRRYA